MKIGEKTIFQIILEEDTETLDEVVVVGYGTQTKKSLTGAVSDVKSDALTRSVSTTTAGALSGKMQEFPHAQWMLDQVEESILKSVIWEVLYLL